MLKKITSLIILFGGLLMAQTTDYAKDKIKNQPKAIEESFTKAIIRANIIEDYSLEYHIKTTYNKSGYITQKDSYSENGDLIYSDIYSYDDQNRLVKIETINPNQDILFIRDFEYTENGYTESKSENDVVVLVTSYELDKQGQIISQKETNYLDENLVSERINEYKNNVLIKTDVKFKNGGYTVKYKYNAQNLPTEEIVYDLNNKLVSKKLRAYDEQQNIVEENLYDNHGKLKTNHRIKYEYDDKGNWTTRTQYANTIEEPISNAKRTIRY